MAGSLPTKIEMPEKRGPAAGRLRWMPARGSVSYCNSRTSCRFVGLDRSYTNIGSHGPRSVSAPTNQGASPYARRHCAWMTAHPSVIFSNSRFGVGVELPSKSRGSVGECLQCLTNRSARRAHRVRFPLVLDLRAPSVDGVVRQSPERSGLPLSWGAAAERSFTPGIGV